MRNRWFHAPLLHTEHDTEKKVTWLELFYDLIFVAAIIQLGDALSQGVADHRTLSSFMSFAGHFIPLWIAWTGFTFYANRFTVDDFLHRILVFLNMFAVGAMAIAAPEAMREGGSSAAFSIAYAVAQALIAIMYARAYYQVAEGKAYARYWGSVFGAGAVLWTAAAFTPQPYGYVLWALGIAAILTAPVSRQSRALADELPTDFEHLSERYGLLTIIVLGESFVKVLSYLASSGHGAHAEWLLKGCLNLLVTCCVWWIYFDDVAGSRIRTTRGAWIVWLFGHLPLTLGMTAVGVALKKAVTFDLGEIPDESYGWLLAGTLALTLMSVAVIDSVTERRQAELKDGTRVKVRGFSAVLVLLLGVTAATMTAGWFLGIIAAVCVGQVLFDMMMAPLEEHDASEHTTSIADLARRRAGGDKTAPRAGVQVGDAVRKGAPSELRNDLYFFFMEGSWTRMILFLVFLYLLINVFFAGIYLLDPSSIAGRVTPTFLDAFAFSVQTMSTIGYGALSPGSPYGDLVVTIEAAVGLLAVALSTGLMFAKASRPRSSVLFSRDVVITTMHGKKTMMFRAGNARGNEVVEATMSVAALIDELSPEGHHIRRLKDVHLLRPRSPLFTLSWTVMHEINEQSPLFGMTEENAEKHLIALVATMLGHDSTYGQTVHARATYRPEDFRFGRRFVDVMSQLDDGRMLIDYAKFHDTEPDAPQAPSDEVVEEVDD